MGYNSDESSISLRPYNPSLQALEFGVFIETSTYGYTQLNSFTLRRGINSPAIPSGAKIQFHISEVSIPLYYVHIAPHTIVPTNTQVYTFDPFGPLPALNLKQSEPMGWISMVQQTEMEFVLPTPYTFNSTSNLYIRAYTENVAFPIPIQTKQEPYPYIGFGGITKGIDSSRYINQINGNCNPNFDESTPTAHWRVNSQFDTLTQTWDHDYEIYMPFFAGDVGKTDIVFFQSLANPIFQNITTYREVTNQYLTCPNWAINASVNGIPYPCSTNPSPTIIQFVPDSSMWGNALCMQALRIDSQLRVLKVSDIYQTYLHSTNFTVGLSVDQTARLGPGGSNVGIPVVVMDINIQ